jgi:hypothetical protein
MIGLKSGSLNLLETSGPVQACNKNALSIIIMCIPQLRIFLFARSAFIPFISYSIAPLRCVAFVPSSGARTSVPLGCPNEFPFTSVKMTLTQATLMDNNVFFFFVQIIVAWVATTGGEETTGLDRGSVALSG